MINLQHKHMGIVLAAGASSRMTTPKALLDVDPHGPLAAYQVRLMQEAGLQKTSIVLGHDGERLAHVLREHYKNVYRQDAAASAKMPGLVVHHGWADGRFSSVQAGIRAAEDVEGVLILPVDAVGIRQETLEQVMRYVDTIPAAAVRPCCDGSPGHLLWVHRSLFPEICAITPDENLRFDQWISDKAVVMDVDDSAILNNVNTLEAWTAWLRARG